MTTSTVAIEKAFEDEAESDIDFDSRPSSPSERSHDEDDESVDALIERYKEQHLDRDDSDDDEKYGDLDDGNSMSVSKPIVRLKIPLYEAPEFVQRLRGYNEATVGTSVSFVAHFKALPSPTVKWFKDEEEVCASERIQLDSSPSANEGIIRLIIKDVRTTDEGAYKCKVENQEGVASTTGYLSVTGGETRSRKTGRTTSSRGGKLSSPSRSPGVSSPPLLRPIAEQKSMEESEERELARQPPSPLQAFIDSIRHSAKSRHPPIFYGTENIFGQVDDNIANSDGEDEVFDSEDDGASVATSSDGLEHFPTVLPTNEINGIPTFIDVESATPECINNSGTVQVLQRPKSATENDDGMPVANDNFTNDRFRRDADTRLLHAQSADVVDDTKLSSSSSPMRSCPATTKPEVDCRSPSTFQQRRLGRLQLQHHLAIDLPDYSPSVSAQSASSSCTTSPDGSFPAAACDVADSANASASTQPQSNTHTDIEDIFRTSQNAILTMVDNPVIRFYSVFVAIASTFANVFGIRPSWLVLFVALASFVTFHLFRQPGCTAASKSSRKAPKN